MPGEGVPALARERIGTMYGLIGKMRAVSGQRDALLAILLEGIQSMPGCLSYVVAKDPADADAIWITEVWDGPDSHRASFVAAVGAAGDQPRQTTDCGFGSSVVAEPVGGHGLHTPTD